MRNVFWMNGWVDWGWVHEWVAWCEDGWVCTGFGNDFDAHLGTYFDNLL